ncbi:hypothetical protein Tco_0573415 [Tanacetum coccineum]
MLQYRLLSCDTHSTQKPLEYSTLGDNKLRKHIIYHPDEYLHEDDPSRQYQSNFDISYYVIPHGRSLTELIQSQQLPDVPPQNEFILPLTEAIEDHPYLANTEDIKEQNIQDEQIITQPIDIPSGNDTEAQIPTLSL